MRCLCCHRDGVPSAATVCPGCGAYLPSLLRDVLPAGTFLKGEDYHIDYALGRGGFGITYRAVHVLLDSVVAIKEHYPQDYAFRDRETGCLVVTTGKRETYQRGLQRFIREGRILSSLRHPNVVRVQNLFEERDTAYLVMDYLHGSPLTQVAADRSGGFPHAWVEKVVGQLVAALTAIHETGVYHLDLKPDNVMITPGDQVVLVDFGAARRGYTGTSTQPFTPEYAAPEVMAGADVGPESDLFSLGMMLHELITNKPPPPAVSRLTEKKSRSWRPTVAEPWKTLLEEALCLDKEDRPSSVRDWWDRRSRAIKEPRPPVSKLSVKCPSCHRSFSVGGSGTCRCPSCRWEFEVDAHGEVIAGWPIIIECPNPDCHFEIVTKAGAVTCPRCNWKFTVDERGTVVDGRPIRTGCPHCLYGFYAARTGAQRCPKCGWEFEIDQRGLVVAGRPIMTQCPNCSHDFPVTGAGEWDCPACGWTFMIDRYGNVRAGKPIDVTCPVCTHRFRVQRSGRQRCPVCQSELQISHTGVATDRASDDPSDL
jgi:serine/threonine protein kinase